MTNANATELARALDLLQQQDWEAAHAIVQQIDDPLAYRIHGLVHRIEGDPGNARYWYGRARVAFDEHRAIDDEIEAVRRMIV